MKKTLILFILSLMVFTLTSCSTKKELNNDHLNLFNNKPPIKVDGGTDKDPLNLFGDTNKGANSTSTINKK